MFIRRIAPFSFAKNFAAVFFALGAISALVRLIEALYTNFALPGTSRLSYSAAGLLYGLLHLLVFPVLYAVVAFIIGLLGAFLYNRISAVIGPIEIELSETSSRRSHRKAPVIRAPDSDI